MSHVDVKILYNAIFTTCMLPFRKGTPENFNPLIFDEGREPHDPDMRFDWQTMKWGPSTWEDAKLDAMGSHRYFYTHEKIDSNSAYVGELTVEGYSRFLVKDIRKVWTLVATAVGFRKLNEKPDGCSRRVDYDPEINEFDENLLLSLVEVSFDNIDPRIQEIVDNREGFVVTQKEYDQWNHDIKRTVEIIDEIQAKQRAQCTRVWSYEEIKASHIIDDILAKERRANFKLIKTG